MKVTIVIPTYNEVENIRKLIPIIVEEVKGYSNFEFNILVVDGNSPDGTGDIVLDLSKKFKSVHLLLEKKKAGLGAAYLYGFKYAIEKFSPDILVEMDADFQHDPKDLGRLVSPIADGYDYVIGSRFTKGGSIPRDWALYRKFLSFGGNIFSKFVLGMFTVNDFTSGFKASRVKGFVDKLDLESVLSSGFAYKIDLLYRMHKLGAKIKEIPIAFGMRDRGNSKMENNNALDSLKVVLSLRINENKNFFKFVAVGFTGLFVDSGLFNILRLIGSIGSMYAAPISGFIAMLTTFYLNNFWSFDDRKIKATIGKLVGVIFYVALYFILAPFMGFTYAVAVSGFSAAIIIFILDKLKFSNSVSFNGVITNILNVLTYFMFSAVPVVIRSDIVRVAVLTFGDSFIVSNVAFFGGIILGLIWNFAVYSRIIWKK